MLLRIVPVLLLFLVAFQFFPYIAMFYLGWSVASLIHEHKYS